MKIVALVHAYVGMGRNAGAETTLHDLLRNWVARGAEVTVCLDQDSDLAGPTTMDGVLVLPYLWWDDAFGRLAYDSDIIISHLDCSERSAYLAEYAHKPMVHLVHNTMWQTEGYLSLGCQLAIYNTEWVANHHTATQDSPLTLVANTQDPDLTSIALMSRKESKWPYVIVHPPIDYDHYVVPPGDHVTLVNLFESKGAVVFFEMARRFPEQSFLAVEGGYGEQYQPAVKPSNVTILPNQEDFREVLQQTRILLVPSAYESFGRVPLEGAAAGIPSVCSATPGLVEALGPAGRYANLTMVLDDFGRAIPQPTSEDYDKWEIQIQLLLDEKVWKRASEKSKARALHWKNEQSMEMDRCWKALVDLDMRTKFG